MPLVALLACASLWLAGDGAGYTQTGGTFAVGRLVQHVPSASAPGQHFTLYIPTSYRPAQPAPVLYLLDPRGRARIPASLFREAAERYGYILVSSHNSQSDVPITVNLQAMQAMWDDSHTWFNLDAKRLYLGGFSGTARVATLIARTQPGVFAGIVSAGAGFHPDAPPAGLKAAYFATIGDTDYNYHELEAVEAALIEANRPHRIQRFPGAHSWMPADLAGRAVDWMELRAMQAAARPRDEALIQALWERDRTTAGMFEREGRVLDAGRRYAAMARDYAGLRDVTEIAAAAARSLHDDRAETEARSRRGAAREAAAWIQHAMQIIADAFPEDGLAPLLQPDELARQLEVPAMKKQAAGAEREVSLEAQRRMNELDVQLGFYLPYEAMARSELTRAAFYLSVALRIDDASPVTWYLTAETQARMNARQAALAALRRAVDAGFSDLASLENDPDLRAIREQKEFQDIVAPVRERGDTLDVLKVDRPPVRTPR
jgi:predicted esterase